MPRTRRDFVDRAKDYSTERTPERRHAGPKAEELYNVLDKAYNNYWRKGISRQITFGGQTFDKPARTDQSLALYNRLHGVVEWWHNVQVWDRDFARNGALPPDPIDEAEANLESSETNYRRYLKARADVGRPLYEAAKIDLGVDLGNITGWPT